AQRPMQARRCALDVASRGQDSSFAGCKTLGKAFLRRQRVYHRRRHASGVFVPICCRQQRQPCSDVFPLPVLPLAGAAILRPILGYLLLALPLNAAYCPRVAFRCRVDTVYPLLKCWYRYVVTCALAVLVGHLAVDLFRGIVTW